MQLNKAPTLVERVDCGMALAMRAIANRPVRLPIGVETKALAHGVLAWRDLMEGVLAGDAEALSIARAAVQRHRWPEPAEATS